MMRREEIKKKKVKKTKTEYIVTIIKNDIQGCGTETEAQL